MGAGHLERLAHSRDVIARNGRYDTSRTKLLCFSGAGFNRKAVAAESDQVILVDLPMLYG